MCGGFSAAKTSPHCPVLHQVVIRLSQGCLVGRMVGTTRCIRKDLRQSQAMDEELATTLVNIEAAMNSRPITKDIEDALRTAHFFLWRKTDSVTLWNRTTNCEKSHEGHQRTVVIRGADGSFLVHPI